MIIFSHVSDHDLVTWTLSTKTKPTRRLVGYKFRSLKNVDWAVSKLTYYALNFIHIQPAPSMSSLSSSTRSSPTLLIDTVHCMNGRDSYQLDETAGGCHQKQSKPRDNDDSWRDVGNLHTRLKTTCPTENRVVLHYFTLGLHNCS